jgi:hypothetical protein
VGAEDVDASAFVAEGGSFSLDDLAAELSALQGKP